jgi:hypothetical protein
MSRTPVIPIKSPYLPVADILLWHTWIESRELPREVSWIIVMLCYESVVPMFSSTSGVVHIIAGNTRFYWDKPTNAMARLEPIGRGLWPEIMNVPGSIRGIVSGERHTMVWTDRGRFMYGSNYYSQLGIEHANEHGAYWHTDFPIISASCGDRFVLVIGKGPGGCEVYEWGCVAGGVQKLPKRTGIMNPTAIAARGDFASVVVGGRVYLLPPGAWYVGQGTLCDGFGMLGEIVRVDACKKWWIIQTAREYVVVGDDWENVPGTLQIHSLPIDWELVLNRKLVGPGFSTRQIISVDAKRGKPIIMTPRGIYMFDKTDNPGVCIYKL